MIHVIVIIAGSKGKEQFRRPLHKGSNTPWLRRLPLLGICRSSFGAGVPAEAEWSWIWHVFDGGVTSIFVMLLQSLDSSSGSTSGLFCCVHGTTLQEVLRLPSAFFFHPPSATLYSLVLFYYVRILDTGSRGSPQAPYPN